jgi:hypothetical protein
MVNLAAFANERSQIFPPCCIRLGPVLRYPEYGVWVEPPLYLPHFVHSKQPIQGLLKERDHGRDGDMNLAVPSKRNGIVDLFWAIPGSIYSPHGGGNPVVAP